jgi:hypothetical protein
MSEGKINNSRRAAMPRLVGRGQQSTGHMFLKLRQVVGYGEPRCLGADKNMLVRPDGGCIDECAHGDMHEGAVAHKGIEQRAAGPAIRVVATVILMRFSLPLVIVRFPLSIPANGLKAEPVALRQFE